MTAEALCAIPLFSDIDDDALGWLAEHAEEVKLHPGGYLNRKGDPADRMFALLDGGIHFSGQDGGSDFTVSKGDLFGVLPHSRMATYGLDGRASEASTIVAWHKDDFGEMIERFPKLEALLVGVMADRIRETTRMNQQRQQLVSLGTLAAGLAHELNNPASAAKRAAQNLCETLIAFDERASRMLRFVAFKEIPPEDAHPYQPLIDRLDLTGSGVGALEESEREDELADYFEEIGAEKPWEAAATLASVGIDRAFMEGFAEEHLKPDFYAKTVDWLVQDVEMRLLASELADATTRISDLVTSMKSYSHMDRGEGKEDVDLHRGLSATLRILKHKWSKKGITLTETFAEDLPHIPGYAGELNQVWTNLIDNAIAAVPDDGGAITVCTQYDQHSGMVEVRVMDNGHGIPPEAQSRIFEPFFTTKKQGEGTGLGLDIAYRIITRRHGGSLRVSSEPGSTQFQVKLPVTQ